MNKDHSVVAVVGNIIKNGDHGPFAFCHITTPKLRASFSLEKNWSVTREPKSGELVICNNFGMKVRGGFFEDVRPMMIQDILKFKKEILEIQEQSKEHKKTSQEVSN